MSFAVSMITRGFICLRSPLGQVLSCDSPVMQQTLEVRPTVSRAGMALAQIVEPPIMTTGTELRPSVTTLSDSEAPSDLKPKQTTALEMKPITKPGK